MPLVAAALALGLILAIALAGLITRREIEYHYDDLAPHVRRIVERERVKAEIDAANRIQAALLPACDPSIDGMTISSHYRAATEIGGDYFDFLELENDRIGVAFGDVAGHGLTSGIVIRRDALPTTCARSADSTLRCRGSVPRHRSPTREGAPGCAGLRERLR